MLSLLLVQMLALCIIISYSKSLSIRSITSIPLLWASLSVILNNKRSINLVFYHSNKFVFFIIGITYFQRLAIIRNSTYKIVKVLVALSSIIKIINIIGTMLSGKSFVNITILITRSLIRDCITNIHIIFINKNNPKKFFNISPDYYLNINLLLE